MNIEFKTHQLVVAGMDTQIKLLTSRCIEWQQKLAEEKARATKLAAGLDAACATIAAVQVLAEGGKLPENPTCPPGHETNLEQVFSSKPVVLVEQLTRDVQFLTEALIDANKMAAAVAEQHELELKEIKANARKRARNRK